MRTLIINVLVFGLMGAFLSSQGMYITTWKFWVVMISMAIIQFNNSIPSD